VRVKNRSNGNAAMSPGKAAQRAIGLSGNAKLSQGKAGKQATRLFSASGCSDVCVRDRGKAVVLVCCLHRMKFNLVTAPVGGSSGVGGSGYGDDSGCRCVQKP
jgi:hypothetical protein